MYKLFTDRNENFQCEVSVKNASLKNAIARLVIESINGPTLVFNGKLEGNGCIIPIKKLKGLMEENDQGTMNLEIIVEDTYFKPWHSEFVVEEHTSVKIKPATVSYQSTKPIVEVKMGSTEKNPLKEICLICETFGIKKNNIRERKSDFLQIIKEYFKSNKECKNNFEGILTKIINSLR